MLGVIVGVVVATLVPEDFNLRMEGFISQPVETHIPGFGAFAFHVGMDKVVGSGIVSFHRCWYLWMTKIREGLAEMNDILCIVEQGSCFSFGGGGNNVLKGLLHSMIMAPLRGMDSEAKNGGLLLQVR